MVQPVLGKFAAGIAREALISLVKGILSPEPENDEPPQTGKRQRPRNSMIPMNRPLFSRNLAITKVSG